VRTFAEHQAVMKERRAARLAAPAPVPAAARAALTPDARWQAALRRGLALATA